MILYPGDSDIASAAAGVDKMKTILAQSKIYIGDYYFYKRLNFTRPRSSTTRRSRPIPIPAPAQRGQEAPGRPRREGGEGSRSAPGPAEEAVLAVLDAPRRRRPMTRAWGLLLVCRVPGPGLRQLPDGRRARRPPSRRSTSSRRRTRRRWRSPGELVSTMMREAFIKDGRVTLVDSAGDADATLEVTLVKYQPRQRRQPRG